MAKKQTEWTRAYNEKAYDRLAITVPKGAKEALERAAAHEGKSINGYVNDSLAQKMGVESLKVYSVLVTEREQIFSGATGKAMDDRALDALNGFRRHEEVVIAESPHAAIWEAAERNEKLPPEEGFYPDSTEYESRELGEIKKR